MSCAQMNSLNKTSQCPKHCEHLLSYCCFDPECPYDSLTCVLCLKNDHSRCKNDFIVFINDVFRRIQLSEEKPDKRLVHEYEQNVEEIMDLFIQKTMMSLESKKRAIMSEVGKMFLQNTILIETESWRNQKKNIIAKYDPDLEKVLITSRGNSQTDKMGVSIEKFEKQTNKVLDTMLNRFSTLRSLSRKPFPSNRWRVHPDLYLDEQTYGSLMIGSLQDDSSEKLKMIVLNYSLQRFIIEIEIKELGSSAKILEVGVLDSDGLVTLDSTLEERPNEEISCYWDGVTQSANVQRMTSDTKNSSATGHQVGTKFCMESDDSTVKWYDANRTFEYHCKSKKGKHFLYFAIKHHPTSFVVTFIS